MGRPLKIGLLAGVIVAMWPLSEPPMRTLRIIAQRPPAVLAVPVDGVSRTALRDSWHAPRGNGRQHEGIDIFARRGTVVRAAVPGIVWRVGHNRLGGNVVWVLGPGAQLHYYAHLDEFGDVASGRLVAAGDALGTVGTTGNARGGPPHLHYGIYTAMGPVNPFPRLQSRLDVASPVRRQQRRHSIGTKAAVVPHAGDRRGRIGGGEPGS